jgi:hypothetical protein
MSDNRYIEKINLCVLRTQEGKTFISIKDISNNISEDIEKGRSIHIVFTANTLNNNGQFASRLTSLEAMYGEGSVVICSSSKAKSNLTRVKNIVELKGKLLDSGIKVIVMCNNKIQKNNCEKIMSFFNSDDNNKFKRVCLYYDEIHEYIELMRHSIEIYINYRVVYKVVMLTATPSAVFKYNHPIWSKINTYNLDDITSSNYSGFNDMDFICEDSDFPITEYATTILEKYPFILSDNKYSFIPGDVRTSTHDKITSKVFEINDQAVVISINSKKNIIFNNGNIPIITENINGKDEELIDTIVRILDKQNLMNRPKVVTGYKCVSLGQTLINQKIGTFNYAIISHKNKDKNSLYQLYGRLTCRGKHWGSSYIKTSIYCPELSKNIFEEMENNARRIATHYNGSEISYSDYNNHESLEKKSENRCERIPVIINLTDDESNGIIGYTNYKIRRENVKNVIKNRDVKLYNFINNSNVKCVQITEAKKKPSYKKHILDVVNAKNNNRVYSTDLKEEDKTKNNYQVFIDNKEKRLCILLWVLDNNLYEIHNVVENNIVEVVENNVELSQEDFSQQKNKFEEEQRLFLQQKNKFEEDQRLFLQQKNKFEEEQRLYLYKNY